jgi:5-methyltetrahydropteroyltriglutamate--homocysteine methyltransferase
MTRTKPPFRADHVGSLKRPDALQQARERLLGAHTPHANLGAHENGELRALEDEAILETIRLQEDCGLQSITDGEIRRRSWWTDFVLGFDGIVASNRASRVQFRDAAGQVRTNSSIALDGRIGWRKPIFADAFQFVRRNTGRTAKLTIPSPTNLLYFLGGDPGSMVPAYADRARFWADASAAYRSEIERLYLAGCRYLQLDDVTLAFLCDDERRAELKGWNLDPEALLGDYIAAINAAVAERPPDLVVTLHICRGNFSGAFGASGGYDPIAERLFGETRVDGFFLEYDTPRAGSFAPLSHMPAGKMAVLGLVTTKSPALEERDALRRRIDEAARSIAADQLCLSPQCGFSSNYLGNPLTLDDQRRKLALVVSVADAVWGGA